jgi:hypothetical protein
LAFLLTAMLTLGAAAFPSAVFLIGSLMCTLVVVLSLAEPAAHTRF